MDCSGTVTLCFEAPCFTVGRRFAPYTTCSDSAGLCLVTNVFHCHRCCGPAESSCDTQAAHASENMTFFFNGFSVVRDPREAWRERGGDSVASIWVVSSGASVEWTWVVPSSARFCDSITLSICESVISGASKISRSRLNTKASSALAKMILLVPSGTKQTRDSFYEMKI